MWNNWTQSVTAILVIVGIIAFLDWTNDGTNGTADRYDPAQNYRGW